MTPKEIEPHFSVLLDAFADEMNSAYFCPRTNVLLDRVLLGLSSKGITLGRAICHLVKGGFYAEALGVSRSSIECFLLAKCISNKEPEKRAVEYVNFFKAHVYNVEQIRKKYFSKAKPPTGTTKQWIEDAKTIPNKHGWMSAYNMAMEKYEDPLEANRKTGKLYQASFDYDGLYEKTSHYVHCTSLALQYHVQGGGKPFTVFKGEGDELNGYLSLQYAVCYVLMSNIIVFRHFGKTVPKSLEKQLFGLLREMAVYLPKHRLIYGRSLAAKVRSKRRKKRIAKNP